MALLLRLEDFDAQNPAGHGQDAEALAALPGYDAGFAAGRAAALAERSNLDAALVQTLSDMAFGFAEARQHVLQSVTPLFRALVDQVLPSIVDDAFRARLLETLGTIAHSRVTGPVRLIVHPDQIDAVAALVPNVQGIEIDLRHDPEIGAHGALISHGTAESTLDLDDLVAQISDVLCALFDQTPPAAKEMPHHG